MWDGTDDLEDLDNDGRIILKLIKMHGERVWGAYHDMDRLWAVVKTVMNIWRNKCKR